MEQKTRYQMDLIIDRFKLDCVCIYIYSTVKPKKTIFETLKLKR